MTTQLSSDELEVFRFLEKASDEYEAYLGSSPALPLPIESSEIDFSYRDWSHPVSLVLNPK